jgi:hypothetical protein
MRQLQALRSNTREIQQTKGIPLNARAAALASRGSKHTCANSECGQRFYDLNKLPTPCPYCGSLFTPAPVKVFDLTASGRPSKYRVYKIQQVETPVDDVPLADVPVIDAADEETVDTAGDEVLEIEEDDDDTLRPALEDRGDV